MFSVQEKIVKIAPNSVLKKKENKTCTIKIGEFYSKLKCSLYWFLSMSKISFENVARGQK